MSIDNIRIEEKAETPVGELVELLRNACKLIGQVADAIERLEPKHLQKNGESLIKQRARKYDVKERIMVAVKRAEKYIDSYPDHAQHLRKGMMSKTMIRIAIGNPVGISSEAISNALDELKESGRLIESKDETKRDRGRFATFYSLPANNYGYPPDFVPPTGEPIEVYAARMAEFRKNLQMADLSSPRDEY